VVWAADAVDDDRFLLFEIYQDRAAADANGRQGWFERYMAEAGALLADVPTLTWATPRWSKGVPD
jgi:quinol monooxygenase YgiN